MKGEKGRRIEDATSPRRVSDDERSHRRRSRGEAYFARGLLAEDRRSHEKPLPREPTRRDACLSRKRVGKKAERRERVSRRAVMAAATAEDGRAEFLRDRGRATRQSRLYFLCKPVIRLL